MSSERPIQDRPLRRVDPLRLNDGAVGGADGGPGAVEGGGGEGIFRRFLFVDVDAETGGFVGPDHAVVDYNQRIIWGNTIMAYFAKYLKGEPAWWENMYKDKNL